MKKRIPLHLFNWLMMLSIIGFFSCVDDTSPTEALELTGQKMTYPLVEIGNSGVSGSAIFEEGEDGYTKVTLILNGTPENGVHPSHIHFNSASEGGDIAISLNPVDGGSGVSTSLVNKRDDGTSVSYNSLINFDGYINVHLSHGDLGTIVAQGDMGGNALAGDSKTYNLLEKAVPGISGTITFQKRVNGSTLATIDLEGTPDGGSHPAHIHSNSAAEGGPIAISFNPVDGSTGMSTTIIETNDEGTPISYEDILSMDGYVNVHLSSNDLGTIVSQADIGVNELTDQFKIYSLGEKAVPGISGTVTFKKRISGYTLATIQIDGTPEGGSHPAHIHYNTAAEGGGIAVSFNPVDGNTGMSMTTIRQTDDGNALMYDDILSFDGYVNVHLSAEQLGTIVSQGDIGQNELTGNEKIYSLGEKMVPGISGSIKFQERVNGLSLATISLDGTPERGSHPAHIHANTAAEGGGIVISFNPVDGTTGMSMTTIRQTDAGNPMPYADILNVDGYVNVHLSASQLGTIVAQGDIGQNELTGNEKIYSLGEKMVPGISGSIKFQERVNGLSLATISLDGTPDGGSHPAHIHANTAAEGGGIVVSFNPVDGTTGMSMTTIRQTDAGDPMPYADILDVDGYVNVHLSGSQLGTIVAHGDIGQNELTGNTMVYALNEKDVPGISGTITFAERVNGFALATIAMKGTPEGGSHPAHIHANSASEGGPIIFSFNAVDGTTGMSMTNVEMLESGDALNYAGLMNIDGYVNVHLSSDQLGTIVGQGNIGINN
ncbi:CHRD domain-containing protein [Echinicola salinicaeni]|uniref:CHRD domain-containing protein n=1 Tax=Echinicola salinicaeni TaxID=2762757 RepID=UPI001647698F|nr:CHRD domain-containing protein [Echinicola salinicaeni]